MKVRAVRGEYALEGDVTRLAVTGEWNEVLAELGTTFTSG